MNIEFIHAMPGVIDAETFAVRIPVKVDGKVVKCMISQEALQDHFQAGQGSQAMVDAFQANRGRIEEKAREALEATGGEPVFLRSVHF